MDILIAASTDWLNTFRPAVSLLLSGGNPYTAVFFNPPWTLFPLIPFYLFPWGRELLFLVAVLAFVLSATRMGASPLSASLFTLSPFTFNALLWGNIEWLALLILATPGPLGILLAMVKPQMTIGIIFYFAVREWQIHSWRGVARLTAFPLAATVLSFPLFGFWPVKTLSYTATLEFSLFPWLVPVGLYLLVRSIRENRLEFAVAASPMFFPSITPQTWLVTFLALVWSTPRSLLAFAAAWGLVLATHYVSL